MGFNSAFKGLVSDSKYFMLSWVARIVRDYTVCGRGFCVGSSLY